MQSGGSVSPLEKHAQRIFTLIAEQPDLTLDEMVRVLRKRRIPASRSALSRFFARHNITVKKSLIAAERKRDDVARARRRWMTVGCTASAIALSASVSGTSTGSRGYALSTASTITSLFGRTE